MKKCFILLMFFLGIYCNAQIGVNTEDPRVTFHMEAYSSGAVTGEGLIVTRLKKSELISRDSFYPGALDDALGLGREGTLIYVYDIDVMTSSPKTQNVISEDYYYFDGVMWQHVGNYAEKQFSYFEKQPMSFSFYELGTEIPSSLNIEVHGPGIWSYQWYQVIGNNVHVRIGKPIGSLGTVTGSGATTTSFTPTGTLKGTTRNAANCGFYKFYCVATSNLGTRIESDIAEVAVGCGAKNIQGEWISFLCFNLGATEQSISGQKSHSLSFSPGNSSDGRHFYISGEETVYGDLYQWGRIGDGHEKRGVSAGFVPGSNVAGTNQVSYNTTTPPVYEDGNLIGASQRYPWRQITRSSVTANNYYGQFIITSEYQNYNWAFNLPSSQIDQLWRTGRFAANDPCAKIKEDGLTYETYYPATNGISGSNTGWRTPSQDEWGSIYKGGTISGSPETAVANTWEWYGSNGRGYEIKPDGFTTTLFLPACGYRSNGLGSLYYQGNNGLYWSISASATNASGLNFSSSNVYPVGSFYRGRGFALRCVKN
ncbi:hypothetical protein [Dysgonomonas sp. GY617]|uniref:hypothetical protein n=1 Tax=Dysgonomonas sp. GY617 TaxID=2780420 RepID=UPI001883B8F1|nr:hypothetical protein [Dysgonomonas sp. GY617]MBF0575985.1 hypothetical protein [Dysgonomonas sp. GY617]